MFPYPPARLTVKDDEDDFHKALSRLYITSSRTLDGKILRLKG
jgi:hypothetical protein